MSQFQLPSVPFLTDFRGRIKVWVKDGNKPYEQNLANGPIVVRKDIESKPLVIVQPFNNDGSPASYPFCFDYEADNGRGVWVHYDPERHVEPAAPVDEESSSIELGASTDVELNDDCDAPKSCVPPSSADAADVVDVDVDSSDVDEDSLDSGGLFKE